MKIMDKQYFLIKINVSPNDEIQLSKVENHSLSLFYGQQRKWKNYENQIHRAILFDIKQNFVSIWGEADVTFGTNKNKKIPYVQTSNFNPINPVIDGKIKAKWLPKRFGGSDWSLGKRIRPISENDYLDMLKSAVDSEQLFRDGGGGGGPPVGESKTTDGTSSVEDLPLEIPTKEQLEQGIRKIQDHLLLDEKIIEEIVIHLTSGRNILLAGPVGTGKTHLAELIPKSFWTGKTKGYDTKTYTATSEWNVHDVIGGIVPRMKDNRPSYEIQYGCVTETVQQSLKDKENSTNDNSKYSGTWLVIDEFNRAEIDKAFGPLFTSLESKEPKTLLIPDEKEAKLKKQEIPKDYRIIGTLNTSDKHYLFKLSDALKRRFTYVELKSPPRKYAEQEIYYALLNAMKELPFTVSSLIQLDNNTKKLADNQSNLELISAVRSAYEILSFVRMTKDMGTAILKSIYQTMLIGTQIKGYSDSVLDMALTGNIIPQLEKVTVTNLEVLKNYCLGDLFRFFRSKYDENDDGIRQQYSDDFGYFLKFIKIPDAEELQDKYQRKNIDGENWALILKSWNIQKSKNDVIRKLPLFQTALDDLKKTFDFL